MKATLSKDSKHMVSHPTLSRLLKHGESCEGSEVWLKQHLPLVNSGDLSVEESAPAKPKAKAKAKPKSKK